MSYWKHFVLFWSLLAVASHSFGQVLISEFMASNTSTLADEDGEFSDWIEIHNAGPSSVHLDGWFLTDSASQLMKWRFPTTNLASGGFLLIFASDKDRIAPGSNLHTNFKLTAPGEYLALVQPDGVTIVSQFGPVFPPQLPDVSFGFGMDFSRRLLVATGAVVRVFVPANGNLGMSWTLPDFDASAWLTGTTGVGFDTGELDHSLDTFANTIRDGSPLAYWRLGEPSGTAASNLGTLGSAANGVYQTDVTLGQVGPRPSALAGFETNNAAVRFDGLSGFVSTTSTLLNDRAAFTVAGWIRPAAVAAGAGLWGQNDAIAFGFGSASNLQLWTLNGGTLTVKYPFALNTWHHVAAVGDGTSLRIFLDGAVAATGGSPTTNYGASASAFKIGGGGIFAPKGNFFSGAVDEVVVYDRALSAEEIARHYQSAAAPDSIASINLARQPGVVASQSSVGYNGPPRLAIDGNTDGNFANGSVTHNQPVEDGGWWEVNLGGLKDIDQIVFW